MVPEVLLIEPGGVLARCAEHAPHGALLTRPIHVHTCIFSHHGLQNCRTRCLDYRGEQALCQEGQGRHLILADVQRARTVEGGQWRDQGLQEEALTLWGQAPCPGPQQEGLETPRSALGKQACSLAHQGHFSCCSHKVLLVILCWGINSVSLC